MQDLSLLIRKLEAGRPFSEADRRAILDLPVTMRTVPAATYLVREGDRPVTCSILLAGFAYRHKLVGDGGRQIVALHIPGEALDFQNLAFAVSDHTLQTLTQAELALVPSATIRDLAAARPAIAAAILRDTLVDAAILREWFANVGRRSARARLAHLLCEYACRLDAQGLGCRGGYEMPMTQEQIGDALGLTSVHVNRSIRALEADGLVVREGRRIAFPDIDRLRAVGDFNARYLHRPEPRPIAA